ncbi:MAG TPA: efflux RND transporter periplasmic adaptor subunit [Vicinamibacteria bacterium]|nr:efflux RND transporter periplasmic adaptor subunit [Vicinamibacteria bacterium]
MTKMTFAAVAIAGAALAAGTAIQARGPGASAPPTLPAAAPRQAVVAADGRVVTYPGGEVVVGAERAGRVVRVRVDEQQVVGKGELLAELESDTLRAARDEARARLSESEAEARLALLTLARREDLARQRIVAAHLLDEARRDVEMAQARVETARAALARVEAELRDTRILAPIAGTVTARHVHPGEMVEVGRRVVTVADLGRLRIEGEADEADAAAVVLGAPVEIRADGFPGRTWTGRVEEIPGSVTLRRLKPQDPARPTDTRVLAVKVAFAEPTPLKLGTTVALRIEVGER